MNLVPSRMAHMYAGLHAKRANPPDGSAPLPDLTAQYPPVEAGRVCVECGDPAEAVARAASAVGTDVRGTMLVDSQASVDLAYDEAMFEPGSLVPCVGKQVQVASGDLLSATHIGTLLLTVRDTSGAWRALRRPGAWLVPGLQMNLLSVRAGKLLGARAPDFDALRVYGTNGEVFPMLDVKPDYVLDSRVLADVLAEKAAAAIARGRNPIQYGTLSDGDAAGIISEIFGGAGADTIRGALGATDGLPDKMKEKILRGLAHLAPDLASNMQSAPSPAADLKSRDKTGTVLSDLSGPHPVCEIGPFRGARYSVSFLDAERDFAAVYFLRTKKPAGIIAALKKFLAECRALDPTYRIRVLRTDRGSEYLNTEMEDFAGAVGLVQDPDDPEVFVQSPGAAYHPDHTRSESLWRTINRFVRSGTRGDARATPLWPYFAKQAIELRNLYDRGGGVSAVERMSGVKPSLKAVRPIGCRAVVKKTDAEMRSSDVGSAKFAARGHEGVYLGTERNGPAYMVWVPSLRRVKYSADVDFDLASFPLRGDAPTTTDFVVTDSPATPDSLVEMNFTGEICAGGDAADYNLGGRPDGGDEGGGDEGGGDEGGGDEGGGDEGGGDEGDDGEEGAGDERDGAGAGGTTRPTRTRRAPGEWWKSGPNALTASALSTRCADLVAGTGAVDALDVSDLAGADEGDAILLQLPGGHYTLAVRTESAFATKVVNTAEALSGPRAAEVRSAVDSEMGGHLERHETFTLIPITDKPVEAQLIDLKLIISEKTGALGEFLKDKARLVARGDQEWGGDPFKKFAPMLRYSTLRLMCALAAMLGRKLYTSDAVQAYLNATLSEPRYGRLPKELREHNSDGVELIAFIRKALYGLAEAGHAWNAEIHQYLTAPRAEGGMGFTRCSFEPCMYVRYEGDDWALLGLACDNAIHLESSDAVHAQVLGALQARFDWVDEGEVSEVPSVLGTKIVQDLEAGTVTLSQEGYVDSLAEEWAEHLSARKISTPASKELEEKVAEAARTKGEARSPALVKRYQRLVGALLFKSVVTGPDIAWAVAMLSRAMAWPTEALMGEAFRCLSYVVQHKSLPIKFSRDTYFSARTGTTVFRRDADQGGLSGVFAIDDGHSDADYAAGPSVSGWAWRAAGAAFLYGSKRQSETMLCSASSELVAGSVAATDGLHARGLKDEMGFPESGPTRLWIDNKATVALAHDPTSFSKIKHVARRHHFLRECVESGALDVGHISTDFNIADLFTKALEPKKFRLFRAAVMNLPIETLRG